MCFQAILTVGISFRKPIFVVKTCCALLWLSLVTFYKQYHLSLYHMAGNIGMELNLAVGKINGVSPNFIPPTFNTCIKILAAYTH